MKHDKTNRFKPEEGCLRRADVQHLENGLVVLLEVGADGTLEVVRRDLKLSI